MADRLKVVFTDNQKEVKVQTGTRMLLRRCCHAVLENEKYKGAAVIGITFADNESYNELQKKHYSIQSETESFTVPESDESSNKLGEIVISLERLVEYADTYNHSVQSRMVSATACGVLELLGNDVERDKRNIYQNDGVELAMYQLGLPVSAKFYVRQ